MTFSELVQRVAELGLDFRVLSDRGEVIVPFRTEQYASEPSLTSDGAEHRTMIVVIKLQDDGRLLRIFAPELYSLEDARFPEAGLKALLAVNWRVRIASFAMDETDGEVRLITDLPIEDGSLTASQIQRLIQSIAWTADELHPVIQRAFAEGEIDFASVEARMQARLKSSNAAHRRRSRSANPKSLPDSTPSAPNSENPAGNTKNSTDPTIANALGGSKPPKRSKRELAKPDPRERRELADLMKAAGGVEGLRKLLEDRGM
ncbi:MAG: YbjN domain-containing protein [Phycisphaerales bacterium]|nr:YbjN domain-containing protein [Phycisphaerales bacterium]